MSMMGGNRRTAGPARAREDYAGAVEYLTAAGRAVFRPGLERTRALLQELGRPDLGLRGALVAGTNGKGSVCAIATSVLVAAGHRVGGMPKPHLQSYTERIRIDGAPVSEAEFAGAIAEVEPAVDAVTRRLEPPSEFEILTAAAVHHLRRRGVDLVICEVGLGGRLDSTNVLDPGVKAVTTVGLDHRQHLGDSLTEIASEKAGILRAGDLAVVGRVPPEAAAALERALAAAEAGGAWWMDRQVGLDVHEAGPDGSTVTVATPRAVHERLRVPLRGAHQAVNAAVAVAVVDAIAEHHGVPIPAGAIAQGVRDASWSGRLEVVPDPERPGRCVVLDGGHNPDAVEAVRGSIAGLVPPGTVPVLVLAVMRDKDYRAMLSLLPPAWPAVFTAVDAGRALPAADLARASAAAGGPAGPAVEGVAAALDAARELAAGDRWIAALGSLALVGAVRDRLGLPPA